MPPLLRHVVTAGLLATAPDRGVPHGVDRRSTPLAFLYLHVAGVRPRGPETCDDPIWWDRLRPVHAALFAVAAAGWLRGCPSLVGAALLLDAVLGAVAVVVHRGSARGAGC